MPDLAAWRRGASQTAVVETAVAGDATIVAAVPGKRIVVTGYVLVAAGAVSARWKSGAGNRSGPMPFGANGGASTGVIFETGVGEALVLNLSGAVAVGGHVNYELIGG